MKVYRVVITDEVLAEVERHLDYLDEVTQSTAAGERWWGDALDAIDLLATFPTRCPRARVTGDYAGEIRGLLVRKCLFFFRIDEAIRKVEILSFRHGAEDPKPGEPIP